ncbi:hypothetical protein [Nostoc sp. DSM 114160]
MFLKRHLLLSLGDAQGISRETSHAEAEVLAGKAEVITSCAKHQNVLAEVATDCAKHRNVLAEVLTGKAEVATDCAKHRNVLAEVLAGKAEVLAGKAEVATDCAKHRNVNPGAIFFDAIAKFRN